MLSLEEIEKLYGQAKYQEIIEGVPEDGLSTSNAEDEMKLLKVGWAYYQLGNYGESTRIMAVLRARHSEDTEIGESARRGLAHAVLQRFGDIERADKIMQEIPQSLSRDNLRMNVFLIAARKGMPVEPRTIMSMIVGAVYAAPYATVSGHIINNGALVLFEARNQEKVEPFLPILPGLIEMAISIYESTGTAENHIAGAEFRASQIFEFAGSTDMARLSAQESVRIWKNLVSLQGGERYERNLAGAKEQLAKFS